MKRELPNKATTFRPDVVKVDVTCCICGEKIEHEGLCGDCEAKQTTIGMQLAEDHDNQE